MNERIAVYPGSYDPLTKGHIDIIKRGLRMFDKIIVAVLKNPTKSGLFTLEERIEILHKVFDKHDAIEVDFFEGLLVDYVKQKKLPPLSEVYAPSRISKSSSKWPS